MPYSTLFPGQEPNEKIIKLMRRHWWVLFKIVFLYFILILLPLVLKNIFAKYINLLESEFISIALGLFLSLYYFFILTMFFRAWLDYYLDIWVITSERVVNIEQKGLFARSIAAFRLYRIQDVTASVKGVLPTLFHYGNVHIQTAGTKQEFIFKQISEPYTITKTIITLVNWKKKNLEKQVEPLDIKN
ncbi:PH domain-containing protein [Patescibacteria group bacterium]|nr:PH domain-containing protein [Patescibacteria group bacterium]